MHLCVSTRLKISAHAFHGLVEQSIEIFELMLSSGVRPDNIAFLGVLSARSQGGS